MEPKLYAAFGGVFATSLVLMGLSGQRILDNVRLWGEMPRVTDAQDGRAAHDHGPTKSQLLYRRALANDPAPSARTAWRWYDSLLETALQAIGSARQRRNRCLIGPVVGA
jgi:hypothetical protein